MARRRAASDTGRAGPGQPPPPSRRWISPGLAGGQLGPSRRLSPLGLPGRGAPPGRAETAARPRPAAPAPTWARDPEPRRPLRRRAPDLSPRRPQPLRPASPNPLPAPPRPPAACGDPDPRRPAHPETPLCSRHRRALSGSPYRSGEREFPGVPCLGLRLSGSRKPSSISRRAALPSVARLRKVLELRRTGTLWLPVDGAEGRETSGFPQALASAGPSPLPSISMGCDPPSSRMSPHPENPSETLQVLRRV
ncbi:basic proline-rich protein-like [Nannospalax galili]|uniref:basic proline-rich protein-like n=1 Tax=Nannospalax galili TaxID=1026970 RepID=UPI00111BCF88|nr:basic proline-rich protein-like [Nannospalax galili]